MDSEWVYCIEFLDRGVVPQCGNHAAGKPVEVPDEL